MIVAKLIQTRPTPFQGGVPRSFWWYLFKKKHLKLHIHQAEGLDISQTQGLTIQSCQNFY
jgi:hypothetical protein